MHHDLSPSLTVSRALKGQGLLLTHLWTLRSLHRTASWGEFWAWCVGSHWPWMPLPHTPHTHIHTLIDKALCQCSPVLGTSAVSSQPKRRHSCCLHRKQQPQAGDRVYMLRTVHLSSLFFVPTLGQAVTFGTAEKMEIPPPIFGFPSWSPQVHGV